MCSLKCYSQRGKLIGEGSYKKVLLYRLISMVRKQAVYALRNTAKKPIAIGINRLS